MGEHDGRKNNNKGEVRSQESKKAQKGGWVWSHKNNASLHSARRRRPLHRAQTDRARARAA